MNLKKKHLFHLFSFSPCIGKKIMLNAIGDAQCKEKDSQNPFFPAPSPFFSSKDDTKNKQKSFSSLLGKSTVAHKIFKITNIYDLYNTLFRILSKNS